RPIYEDDTLWDVIEQIGAQLGRVVERRWKRARDNDRSVPGGTSPELAADISLRILEYLDSLDDFLKDEDKDVRRQATDLRRAALDFAANFDPRMRVRERLHASALNETNSTGQKDLV